MKLYSVNFFDLVKRFASRRSVDWSFTVFMSTKTLEPVELVGLFGTRFDSIMSAAVGASG